MLENDLPIYLSLLPMHLTICPPCRTEIIAFLASQQGRSELFLLDATEHFVPNTDPNHHVSRYLQLVQNPDCEVFMGCFVQATLLGWFHPETKRKTIFAGCPKT